MLRSNCASTRSLRALVAAAALAVPLVCTATASADHEERYRDFDRGSIGTIRIEGRSFCVSNERAAASQIAAAFCRLGYTAWADCDTVVVRTRRGCAPDFRWDGCAYDLCQSWRGDCLVLTLRRVPVRPVVRTDYYCDSRPTVIVRHGGEQSGGYCPPVRRQSVIVTVGPRQVRDDPDWGKRITPFSHGSTLDQGWGRKWDSSIDKGFGMRWNWESRDKDSGRKR